MIQRLKNYFHLLIALTANFWFGFPSRKMTVIGVTGTDGKTTTVNLIYHILNKSGFNASMISSVGAIINNKKYDVGFHVTSPSSWSLQRFIKMINRNKDKNVLIIEVTSHALDQYRTWGIKFDIAVITNITREHLDYHKTYENYVKTKTKLLKNAKITIANRDDESYKFLSKIDFKKLITYGLAKDAQVNLSTLDFQINLPGEFNKYNCLAAVAVAREIGIPMVKIRDAVSGFKLPEGRMDEIYKNSFSYIIDFAHTPNSFLQLLSSIRPDVKGRIIHVFGSAGKRDKSKRPLMGEISSKFSDVIILTAEDPRDESVSDISSDIEKGFEKEFTWINYKNYNQNGKRQKIYFKINDRKEAINFAVSIVSKGDLIISTGKGHEQSMNYGKEEEPWSEYKIAIEAISKYAKK